MLIVDLYPCPMTNDCHQPHLHNSYTLGICELHVRPICLMNNTTHQTHSILIITTSAFNCEYNVRGLSNSIIITNIPTQYIIII